MSKQQLANCSECAYVQTNGNELWCPYYDEPVSKKMICDDFLDKFQAPLFSSLAEDPAKLSLGIIVKDTIAYTLIGGLILLATVCTIGMLS